MSQNYTVKQNDTLSAIAEKLCGDVSLWQKIYHDNKSIIGNNPDRISPGQVLHVSCPSPGVEYEVQHGDNLTKIANKICGNDNWQKIYQENKHIIGDNPNRISPGQVLTIKC